MHFIVILLAITFYVFETPDAYVLRVLDGARVVEQTEYVKTNFPDVWVGPEGEGPPVLDAGADRVKAQMSVARATYEKRIAKPTPAPVITPIELDLDAWTRVGR